MSPDELGVIDYGRPSQQHRLLSLEFYRLVPLKMIDAFLLNCSECSIIVARVVEPSLVIPMMLSQ